MGGKPQWILKVPQNNGGGAESHTLSPGRKVLVGRSRRCDIRVLVPSVSRTHCMFEISADGRLFVSDLGALIPTQLQGKALTPGQSREVKSGDTLVLGEGAFLTAVDLAAVDSAVHTQIQPEHDDMRTMIMPPPESPVPNAVVPESLQPQSPLPVQGVPVPDQSGIGALPSPAGTAIFLRDERIPKAPPSKKVEHRPARFEETMYFDQDESGGGNALDEKAIDRTIVVSDELLADAAVKNHESMENEKRSGSGKNSSNRRLRLILGAALLLSCGVLLLPQGKTGAKSVTLSEYSGSYFNCALPPEWTVMAKGEATVLSGSGDLRSGIALLKIESPDVKYWTFETHVDELLNKLFSELFPGSAPGYVTLITSSDGEMPAAVLHPPRQSLEQIPYVMAQVNMKGFVEARAYLNRDVAVVVLAWSNSTRLRNETLKVLESLSLNMTNASVDRRLWSGALRKEDIPLCMKSAEVWLSKAQVAPGNSWNAYVELLKVRGWFALNGCPADLLEHDRRSYELINEVAETLNSLFLEKRRQALRELHSGTRKAYLESLARLQQEFPGRKDLRWIWAEKSKTAGSAEKKQRLF